MKPIDIPIFVINGFPERAPNIIKELQDKWGYPSHKIRFIYPPIDSHFRSSHYLPCPTWRDPNEHRLLTQGEMKCSVGHLLAWHEISEDKDIDWAIILEDDAELTPWDQGGFYFDGERHDILYLGHKALEPIQEEKRGQGIVKAPYTYWTVGYALTRTAASSLTNVFNKGQVIPSDEFLPYHFGKNPNVGEKHQQCDPVYLRAFLHNPAIVTPSGKWASGTENSQSAFDLVVLLFSTDDTKIEHLEEYKRLKYETYIVGDKVKDWDTSGPAGFQKIPALHSYISRHFNKRDIARTVFLIADGYDTRPVVTPDVLLKRFAEMGKSVVVSGEVNCWPDKRMAESFPKAQETRIYPYPCSGLYMGPRKGHPWAPARNDELRGARRRPARPAEDHPHRTACSKD